MEMCSGCGATTEGKFSIVGVTKDEGGAWAAFPVCDDCWRNPEHRQRPLKMHFFDRRQEKTAVALAGSTDLG